MAERGWVIEHESSPTHAPEYLTFNRLNGQVEWTTDNLEAFRMARKEDAERIVGFLEGKLHRVCEHEWG